MRKISLTIVGLVVVLIAGNWILSSYRESLISQVKVGLDKAAVEKLLGRGEPGVMRPACEACPAGYEQRVYRGNPSMWRDRLEDSIVVCFVDNIVCAISRVGL